MLDTLITSKTRLKMLLKFFTNSASSAYLRELAEEFGESTNSVRHELNNLSKAGYLLSAEAGRTIRYRVNTQHPLYQPLQHLVHKYLGLDTILDTILHKLGDLQLAFVVGDYARGRDSGVIEVVVVGSIDRVYLNRLVARAQQLVDREIRVEAMTEVEYGAQLHRFADALCLWGRP